MRGTEEVVQRVRERTEQYETLQDNNASRTGGMPKKRVRIVLLAACLAVLSLGVFSATAGRGYVNRFLELFGTKNDTEALKNAFIPIGQSALFGPYTVTVEDIIGDADNMWMEISTDYAVDAPDGWLNSDKTLIWFSLNIEGEIIFPKDVIPVSTWWSCSPFIRDGKLWYMYSLSVNRDGELEHNIDLGHIPIRLTVTGHDWNEKGREFTHVFTWENDYTSNRNTVFVNQNVGNCTVTQISTTLTGLEILTAAEKKTSITVEYVKLDDGTVLYCYDPFYDTATVMGSSRTVWNYENGLMISIYNFSLITEFHQKDSDFSQVVPYDRITAVAINGVEISIR